MAEEQIKVAYEYSDIEGKTTDEKLTLLLKIAFLNHTMLNSHAKVLFGNGQEGLCDKVRTHAKYLSIMWGLFLAAGGGLVTLLFSHVSK